MSVGAAFLVASTTLEEFLDRTGASETAERVQRMGLGLGVVGILLATGVAALVLTTDVGRPDRDALVRTMVLGGLVGAFGSVTEVFGIADSLELGWWDAFQDSSGTAPMMRLLGSLLVVFGLVDQLVGDEASDASTETRSVPVFALAGILVALLSFAFDGHTNSEGPRVVHALVDLAHVAAGGVWFGGVAALLILAVRGSLTGERAVVERFASLATVALVVVSIAGVAMAVFILDEVGELTSTTWGRWLILKVALVAAIAGLGTFHHFTIARAGDERDRSGSAVTLAAEAVLFVAVIAVTVVLVTSSPT